MLVLSLYYKVVFTDEQALLLEKATMYSSPSEEASLKDEIMESSQPESQVRFARV